MYLNYPSLDLSQNGSLVGKIDISIFRNVDTKYKNHLLYKNENPPLVECYVTTLSVFQAELIEEFLRKQVSIKSLIIEAFTQFHIQFAKYNYDAELDSIEEYEEIFGTLITENNIHKIENLIVFDRLIIPNSDKIGYFGIQFDSVVDCEHGLGILFDNWKVVNAGASEVAFSCLG